MNEKIKGISYGWLDLWYINPCMLSNAKSFLYIQNEHIGFVNIFKWTKAYFFAHS